MSDNWLQFVPSDPVYKPTAEAAEQAKVLLTNFVPHADAVNVEFKDTIQFFHPHGNWSGVNCPACGKNAGDWWDDAMNSAHQNGFSNLNIIAACCGARVSLNELNYIWPAAFASFVIEAMNPDVENLTPMQEAKLVSCLGCELRRIWVHI